MILEQDYDIINHFNKITEISNRLSELEGSMRGYPDLLPYLVKIHKIIQLFEEQCY